MLIRFVSIALLASLVSAADAGQLTAEKRPEYQNAICEEPTSLLAWYLHPDAHSVGSFPPNCTVFGEAKIESIPDQPVVYEDRGNAVTIVRMLLRLTPDAPIREYYRIVIVEPIY